MLWGGSHRLLEFLGEGMEGADCVKCVTDIMPLGTS